LETRADCPSYRVLYILSGAWPIIHGRLQEELWTLGLEGSPTCFFTNLGSSEERLNLEKEPEFKLMFGGVNTRRTSDSQVGQVIAISKSANLRQASKSPQDSQR